MAKETLLSLPSTQLVSKFVKKYKSLSVEGAGMIIFF